MNPQLKSLLTGVAGAILVIGLYFILRSPEAPAKDPFIEQRKDSLQADNKRKDEVLARVVNDAKTARRHADSLQNLKPFISKTHEKAQNSIRLLSAHPGADAMRNIFAKSGVDTTR